MIENLKKGLVKFLAVGEGKDKVFDGLVSMCLREPGHEMGTFCVSEVDNGACFSESGFNGRQIEELTAHGCMRECFSAFDSPILCREHGEAFIEPMWNIGTARKTPQGHMIEFVCERPLGFNGGRDDDDPLRRARQAPSLRI